MNAIAELVSAYQADKLKLPAVFDALGARGALPEAEYQAEREWLEQQRDAGARDPMIAKALLARLAAVQTPLVPAAPGGDVSMIKPATQRLVAPSTPPPGTDDEAARVQPVSRAAPLAGDDVDDATVVKLTSHPASPPVADEATIVKPASGTPRSAPEGHAICATGTQQGRAGASSSMNSSSWNHIADAETADFVTVGSLLEGRFYLEKEIGRGGSVMVRGRSYSYSYSTTGPTAMSTRSLQMAVRRSGMWVSGCSGN
ncbi:hypothetical protein RHOFW104T7_08025 [Rhodanobacter thiooxydans]|uniref:Uncharacterized protein n=1 Tax=Rhodanobacter thiooxydans TaxID=416169 RepID=A0A154QLA1_9GAMM|nr:hypothetical protein [Rhodanobacter thiooxydans]EIM02966.1 serine/threonine kinase [Rhodanobacter thiooxydans LCS2]KZC24545.1 hypothetical protein RHOFW104T7_08025 [Rhodanobacter thiooxydans]MCW0203312.1 hypothetical protein [Rhodanobacter thiooxydans]